jgi:hypothetical protein
MDHDSLKIRQRCASYEGFLIQKNLIKTSMPKCATSSNKQHAMATVLSATSREAVYYTAIHCAKMCTQLVCRPF